MRSHSYSHRNSISRPFWSASRPTTSYATEPAQAAGDPSKPIAFFKAVARKVSAAMSRRLNLEDIEPTPQAVYQEVAEELRFGYQVQGGPEVYVVDKKIAESSEGEIFVYRAVTTGQLFVVKHTRPIRLSDTDDKANEWDTDLYRFPNEARIHKLYLKPHRNIVNIYETCSDPVDAGRYKIWMEKCAGDMFAQLEHWYIRRRSSVPEMFLLHFIVEAFQALAYLHHGLRHAGHGKFTRDRGHRSIIHGDIKPENIFLRWLPRDIPIGGLPDIVLGDFGTAKLADDTNSTVGCGTLAFHAPEDVAIYGSEVPGEENGALFSQVVNSRTTAADIYGLGQILYMMATKERNPMAIGEDPTGIRVSRDYDTAGLKELIVRCLAVDPSQRADASFDEAVGVMPLVNKVREARLELIRTRFPLDCMEWASPPPPKSRRF